MDEQIQARWYFALPIYEKLLPEFSSRQQRLVQMLLAMRDAQPGIVRSNQGGWHSDDKLHLSGDPDVQWLMQQLLTVASVCVHEFESDRPHGEVVMTTAWANVNDAGSWNSPHMHLPADWSGVFYVSVDESGSSREGPVRDGDIMFFNPMPFGARHKRPTTVNYSPRNGLLLLFPGYLLHMVAPHNAAEPRISISFNLRVPLTNEEIRAVRDQRPDSK